MVRDALAAERRSARWGTRLFLHDEPPMLVGWGGFKGPKCRQRRRARVFDRPRPPAGPVSPPGAVRAMLRDASSESDVRTVIARTRPEPGPSTKVLERIGFVYDGEVADEDEGQLRRWRRDRRPH